MIWAVQTLVPSSWIPAHLNGLVKIWFMLYLLQNFMYWLFKCHIHSLSLDIRVCPLTSLRGLCWKSSGQGSFWYCEVAGASPNFVTNHPPTSYALQSISLTGACSREASWSRNLLSRILGGALVLKSYGYLLIVFPNLIVQLPILFAYDRRVFLLFIFIDSRASMGYSLSS